MASLDEELSELRQRIVTWAARWGVGPDDAQDLAQDVLLKVVLRFAQFRRESRLSSWAYRIARNEQVNHMRRSVTRSRAEARFVVACPASVNAGDDAVLRALDARRQIETLICRGILSEADLGLFEMMAVEGLSSAEAGSKLGLRSGSVRSRLSLAVARIRREVA